MAPVIRGNSLYTIVEGPSWTQAEEDAARLGGNLATIDSSGENSFLWEKYREYLWIGLNDASIEGAWVWSSGSNSDFRNWASGQPDNASYTQDYAYFWFDSNDGTWDDEAIGGNWEVDSGIAEIPLTSSITFSTAPKEGAGASPPPSTSLRAQANQGTLQRVQRSSGRSLALTQMTLPAGNSVAQERLSMAN